MFQELRLTNEMKFKFLTVITVLHSPAIALHPLLPSSCANREWQALLISMPGRSRHSTNMWWINYWQVLHTSACWLCQLRWRTSQRPDLERSLHDTLRIKVFKAIDALDELWAGEWHTSKGEPSRKAAHASFLHCLQLACLYMISSEGDFTTHPVGKGQTLENISSW